MRTFRLRALLAAAIIALPLIAVPLPAGAASGEGTAQISGTVIGPDGKPAAGDVHVEIWRDGYGVGSYTIPIADDGTFSLENVITGDATLHFRSHDPAVLDEYWENAYSLETARVLHLGAGDRVDRLDARLDAAGSVSGRVVDADGKTPFEYARVLLTRIEGGKAVGFSRTAMTGADGTYRIVNVTPGQYRLRFVAASPSGHRPGSMDDWGTPPGDLVTVGRGQHLSHMNGSVWFIGWLSGTVVDANGAGADGVRVTMRYRDGRELSTTADSGDYSFSEVPTGDVTLHFSPRSGSRMKPQWYGGASVLSDATWITIGDVGMLRTKLVGYLEPRGPGISGSPIVGGTLRAHAYASDVDAAVTYQWYANGTAIKGATKPTYKIPSYRVGRSMSVKATFRKPGHITVSRTSKATDKVQIVTAPTVSGTRQVRATLTVKVGAWATGGKLTYRWYADGKQINGETRKTYRVNPGLRGKRISVAVTVSKPGWSVITRASARTSPIRADW